MSLGQRETRAASLLLAIEAANNNGTCPTKADIIDSELPSRTRANHYVVIDRLIGRGLVDNIATSNMRYALQITEAGRTALAEWTNA